MPLDDRRPDATTRRRLVRCHRWLMPPPRPHRRRPRRRPTRRSTGLRLHGVTKEFGGFTAVDDLDLDVPAGSFFALLGPSGCGKTTTLRMVAGLEDPTAGTITLGGNDITHAKPYRRPVNTVFQSYALFPHLDIYENVAFGLRRRGRQGRRRRRCEEMLELVRADLAWPRKPGPALRRPAAARRPGAGAHQPAPRCCCSTSRSAPSTSSCAGRCRSSSSASRPRSASPSSTSPTTRRRP